jgi:hypothetical protein
LREDAAKTRRFVIGSFFASDNTWPNRRALLRAATHNLITRRRHMHVTRQVIGPADPPGQTQR